MVTRNPNFCIFHFSVLWNWQRRDSDLVFVRLTYEPNLSVSRHRGDHYEVWRGAEEMEGVKDGGSAVQLVSQTWPGLLFFCVWCRQVRNGDVSGTFEGVLMRSITHLALTAFRIAICRGMRRRSDHSRLEWRPKGELDELWCPQLGHWCLAFWKQPFNPQPLIFHLLFRVRKSPEI